MSNLSKALQKYYSRQGNALIFRNKQSLNQLAFAMWKELGFKQIDPSVISRVLKGTRLFTAPQLKIFCKLLGLTEREQDYLLICLQQDYNSKLNMAFDITHISNSLTIDLLSTLGDNSYSMFYSGNYNEVEHANELITQLADNYKLIDQRDKTVNKTVGLSLYLKGRTIANGALPSQVVSQISPLAKQLLKQSHSQKLQAYSHILLCNAYYLAGGYSNQGNKHNYNQSIKHGLLAIEKLAEDDHERLFALRCIAISSSYINDTDVLKFVLSKAKKAIPRQPSKNFINALHLSITLSKCLALTKLSDPFQIEYMTSQYFKRDLTNTGVYEVSYIKEKVDTLLLLNSANNHDIKPQIQHGMELAQEYNLQRQRQYFAQLLEST